MEELPSIPELVGGLAALLLLAASIRGITKRIQIPFTVVLVLAGAVFAVLGEAYPDRLTFIRELAVSPDVILYVFLPTLIFQSAYHLDARLLRANLSSVFLLAVPGLLISTAVIGAVVHWATGLELSQALLMGAILSATDPVAVIALFRQVGAPARLTVLVEGESLFNDATAIVLARILVGVAAAGTFGMGTVAGGVGEFAVVFAGGLVVGWLLALVAGWLLNRVESDPFIEITLTTVLAYLSFLLAEDVFHVSGVMATAGAGLTLGGWGRMKISPSVRSYLEHFWQYMDFVATALIFLMLGMRVPVGALLEAAEPLTWVIGAMLVSRALVVYGLTPLVTSLPGEGRVDMRYRTVMFWGGMRGAIALALVLSLRDNGISDQIVTLVTGAVIFTIVVQGLTVKPLVSWLRLDAPPVSDTFARAETELAAKERARARIPELLREGLFSGSVSGRLQREYAAAVDHVRQSIDELRRTQLSPEEEEQLLYLLAFGEEKAEYVDMLNRGHLSEQAFRELVTVITLQIDRIRAGGGFGTVRTSRLRRRRMEHALLRKLDSVPALGRLSEYLRMARLSMEYEVDWGHYQSSGHVLERLEELAAHQAISPGVVERVRERYVTWHDRARTRLDEAAEVFPEFVAAMQERLGRRMVILAEAEAVEENAERGALPESVAEEIQEAYTHELRTLRAQTPEKLRIEPTELLRKVPFFEALPQEEFDHLAQHMRPMTVGEDDVIIQQGEAGDSLFFIARGVVRITRSDDGQTRELATLLAGDFFGEMGSIHRGPRTASAVAVTPCALYQVRRRHVDELMERYPEVRRALEKADRKRSGGLSDS